MSMVIPERIESKYKSYPEYRDSGAEWLDEIPAHWEILSLRRKLQDSQKGIKIGPFGSSLKLDIMQDSGWKVYGQENIITGDFSLGDRYVDDDKYKELEACSTGPGDILITMMGTVGCCQVVPSTAEIGLMDSHLLRLRVKQAELLAKFLALLIDRAQYVKDQLNKFGRGSIMQGLNSSIIKELLIAVPPTLEQEKILDFLGRETASSNELIVKKQKLIELLQEQRTALIIHTVTKGLNPEAPMKDSGVEWLGEIPAHWEIKPVKRVLNVFNGSTPRSSEPKYWDGDIPWVTPEDLGELASPEITETRRYITEAGYASCGTNLVPGGSLVLSTRAPIGYVAIAAVALCTNQGCRSLVPRSTILPRFSYYLICAARQELVSLGQGSTFMELGKSELETVMLPFPKIEEQQAIANYLDQETARIDILVSRINQAIEKLQEYRSALITAAVTGKIDVRQYVT